MFASRHEISERPHYITELQITAASTMLMEMGLLAGSGHQLFIHSMSLSPRRQAAFRVLDVCYPDRANLAPHTRSAGFE